MKGIHHIRIETAHLRYEFDIRRNITVIQGDSATGKTTLIELLRDYLRRGEAGGVFLSSDVPCQVFGGTDENWKQFLGVNEHSIIFFDEDFDFIFSSEFAEEIKGTDNYYVFITRRPLKNLPYSIDEIYGIRTSGKYHFPEKIYHEFYQIYGADDFVGRMGNRILIVEDSNAGFEFFSFLSKGHVECISAKGNANVFSKILNYAKKGGIAVIADGAAFGAYIESIVELSGSIKGEFSLFFPESFEWLILKSGALEQSDIKDILEHPYDYIDSREYFSWERFFNAQLVQRSDGTFLKYNKASLNKNYLSRKISEQIVSVMPDELRQMFEGVAANNEKI